RASSPQPSPPKEEREKMALLRSLAAEPCASEPPDVGSYKHDVRCHGGGLPCGGGFVASGCPKRPGCPICPVWRLVERRAVAYSSRVKREDIIRDIHGLDAELASLEEQYGLLSADFYHCYRAGELEQISDFIRWAGYYE